MKKSGFKFILMSLCLVLFSTQCEEDIIPLTQEREAEELSILKQSIEDLASQSVCNESTECAYIAFGSKPCGGPWSYLVYSTSINTEELLSLVEDYNQKEALYNTTWGISSDCTIVNPPTSVKCENNTCIAVY
jgi:hypothetical protein